MVDIPKSYGLLLSRYWSAQLNGFFSTDWSHLWLPFNGQPFKVRIERERYMKNIVTDLKDPNEPTIFTNLVLGNNSFDSFFEKIYAEISPN